MCSEVVEAPVLNIQSVATFAPFTVAIHVAVCGQIDYLDHLGTESLTRSSRGRVVWVAGDPNRIDVVCLKQG